MWNHLLLNIPSDSLEAKSIKQPNPHHDNCVVSVGKRDSSKCDYPIALQDWIDDNNDTNYLQYPPTYFKVVWASITTKDELEVTRHIISKLNPKHHVYVSAVDLPELLANPCMHKITVYHGAKRYVFTDMPVSNRLERDCNAASTMIQVIACLTKFCGSCTTLQTNHGG